MGILSTLGGWVSSAAGYVGEKIFGDGTYKGSNNSYRDRDDYRSGVVLLLIPYMNPIRSKWPK
ncbi:MAG: hypothetical protein IPI79_06725 [Moraxellaceae bacterium]|nr:hypothetical protein [Moraxellaceae bacterium]